MTHIRIIILALLFHLSWNSQAQEIVSDSTTGTVSYKLYRITKNDGAEYIGHILSSNAREVLIETSDLGEIYIPKHEIKEITEIEDINKYIKGKLYKDNRLYSKYLFTNSAIPLEKEDDYFHLTYIALGEGQFALNKNLSLGFVTSYAGVPLMLTPKLGFKVANNIYIGTSVYLGWGSYILPRTFFAAGTLTATFGNKENNFTINVGYGGIYNNILYTPNYPLLSFAGHKRLNSKLFLNTETLFFNSDQFLVGSLMSSVRWMTRHNSCWDFGLTAVYYEDKVSQEREILPFPIPVIKYTQFFMQWVGKKKRDN